jgi:hypothetical protein
MYAMVKARHAKLCERIIKQEHDGGNNNSREGSVLSHEIWCDHEEGQGTGIETGTILEWTAESRIRD